MDNEDRDEALFTMFGPGLGMAAARKDERGVVIGQLEKTLEAFEAKVAAQENPALAATMTAMVRGMREKFEQYKGLQMADGPLPDESLENFAVRKKAEGEQLFMASLSQKVLRLMLLAGTEGENAKWTQNQLFYGLKEAVPGLVVGTIEEVLTDLISSGYIQTQQRPGKASIQYYLTEGGARCAKDYEERARAAGGSKAVGLTDRTRIVTGREPPPENYDPAPSSSRPKELAELELRIEQGIDKSLTLVNNRLDTLQRHQGLLEARLAKVEQSGLFGFLTPEKLVDGLVGHFKEEHGVDITEEDKPDEDPIGDILRSWGEFETYTRRMFRALGVDDDGNGTPYSRRQADFLGLAIRLSQELYDASIDRLGPNRNESLDADFVLSHVANIHDLLIELKVPGAIERSGKTVRKVCMGIMKDEDEREKEEEDIAKKQKRNEEAAESRRKKIEDTIIKVFKDGKVDQEWLEGPAFQAVYELLMIESFKVSDDEVTFALRIDPRYVLLRENSQE
jgi:hypothetical protein